MFSKRDGEGPRNFVGLHGWSGDHRTFAPLIRYLPPDVTFYSVDLPGLGQTPPPCGWSLAEVTDAIAIGVGKLDSSRVTMVGNCSGAIWGLLALPQIAGLIDRLVVIDPFAYAPWYFRILASSQIGKYAYYSTFANPLGRWITNLSLKGHRHRETDLTTSFREADHEVSYRYLRLLVEIDGIERFSGITHPIDIVYGERTFGAIRRSIAMWQSIWPHARTFELRGAGHLPIEEAAEGLSRIIFSSP